MTSLQEKYAKEHEQYKALKSEYESKSKVVHELMKASFFFLKSINLISISEKITPFSLGIFSSSNYWKNKSNNEKV